MKIYSTCMACEQIMQIYLVNQQRHPNCGNEPNSYIERLEKEYVEASYNDEQDKANEIAEAIERYDNAAPRLAEAALTYAAYGWPVFPCKPGGKAPATKHGFKDATTEIEQIKLWWKQTPRANVALATGYYFDVIDVDAGGIFNWADLRDDEGWLPDVHGWSNTPGSGFHVLVAATGSGNGTAVAPHVDYRGLGGYIVAPPSVLSEYGGRRYRWSVKPSPAIKRV